MIWVDVATLVFALLNVWAALSFYKSWHGAVGWGVVVIGEISDILQHLG